MLELIAVVMRLCRRHDYVVQRAVGDRDVHFALAGHGRLYLVACQAGARPTGHAVVAALSARVHLAGADAGVLIAPGGLTERAARAVEDEPVAVLSTAGLCMLAGGHDIIRGLFRGREHTPTSVPPAT